MLRTDKWVKAAKRHKGKELNQMVSQLILHIKNQEKSGWVYSLLLVGFAVAIHSNGGIRFDNGPRVATMAQTILIAWLVTNWIDEGSGKIPALSAFAIFMLFLRGLLFVRLPEDYKLPDLKIIADTWQVRLAFNCGALFLAVLDTLDIRFGIIRKLYLLRKNLAANWRETQIKADE